MAEETGARVQSSIADSEEWAALVRHVEETKDLHLRDLLADEERCASMMKACATRDEVTDDGYSPSIVLDYSRNNVTQETMRLLFALAEKAQLRDKIDAMLGGEKINVTEDRAVLHTATRAPADAIIEVDGRNVVPDVHDVLAKIKDFSERVRNGEFRGSTGKTLKDVVVIGIGGSYLGPAFVHTALKNGTHRMPESRPDLPYVAPKLAAKGRTLHFLANVDPIDVADALEGLDQERTLVVVVSKTFTTAETMLNARTVRTWITSRLGEDSVASHMVAVSTNLKLVKEFGIDTDNAFAFWDWVGGRYSVCSAVGMLPLSLQYGFDNMERFLEGAHSMDEHWRTAPFEENLPVILGMLSVYNATFKGCPSRGILPYCQALSKLAPHIQQVSMESNGKAVDLNGEKLKYPVGEIDFGEPGTNGQHSFYQLIHQGRVIPCDFIGVIKSQQSVYLAGEIVSNHDELMSNFFAQADALAYGKTAEELRAEGVPDYLIPHKTFEGNRPSLSIMLPALDPYTVGQLLSLYENRVATQGFIWGLNSFDQWGVELGKVLASKVRTQLNKTRTKGKPISGFNYSTTKLLKLYLEGKQQLKYPEPQDVFPCTLLDVESCVPLYGEEEAEEAEKAPATAKES
eukprot:PRCOL_00005031-RA